LLAAAEAAEQVVLVAMAVEAETVEAVAEDLLVKTVKLTME
jgi:hypothetical protein